MPLRFGINGLGRIGRALVRIAHERPELASSSPRSTTSPRPRRSPACSPTTPSTAASPPRSKAAPRRQLAGRAIPFGRVTEPAAIDWSAAGVEMVVEATGRFRRRAAAAAHLGGSVRRVIVSATLADADATFCPGVNGDAFDPARHRVVSNASCTTNCRAAVLAVVHPAFGVGRALMNTVHCVTNSQNLVDMAHHDPRRARSAVANIIPTTSDAFPSIEWVMPELAGRVNGLAMRVPIAAGSLVDVTIDLERRASRDEMAAAFRAAERGALAGHPRHHRRRAGLGRFHRRRPLGGGRPAAAAGDRREALPRRRLVRQRVGLLQPPRRAARRARPPRRLSAGYNRGWTFVPTPEGAMTRLLQLEDLLTCRRCATCRFSCASTSTCR